MKRLTAVIALLATCAFAEAASYDLGDRRLALIDDPLRVEFQSAASAPGKEKIREAIAMAAAAKGWRLKELADGRLEMTLSVRNQHSVRVETTYDVSGYGIRYLESFNLKYRESRPGLRAIHRSYNVWIKELAAVINAGVGASASTSVGFAPPDRVEAVPFLKQPGRQSYEAFLSRRTPRAFAIGPNGAYGWAGPANPDPVATALENCGKRSTRCRLYLVDDHVVWTPPPATPVADRAPPSETPVADRAAPPAARQTAAAPRAPASERLPAVGASWKYSFRDERYRRPLEFFTVQVLQVDGWTVQDSLKRENRQSSAQSAGMKSSINAQELAFVTRRLQQDYAVYELAPYLLALEPGAVKVGQVPAMPSLRRDWRVKVTSVAADQTIVPAGTFKTFRVEVTGDSAKVVGAVRAAQRFSYTAWYAPEAGRYVMLRHRVWSSSGEITSDEVVRLVEYRPN